MKYYEQLVEKRIFSVQDLQHILDSSPNSIASILLQYKKKGYIEQVKKNLYVAISMETGVSVANRYEIGSHITTDGYISHHAAFEFYGITNQLMHSIQITGKKRFRSFSYDGCEYEHFPERIASGVEHRENGIRITNLERTILDSINDVERVGGLSELFQCLRMIPYVDEQALIDYLRDYNKQFLYQKTGFLLEYVKEELKLSDALFKVCHEGAKKSTRYLLSDLDRNNIEYCAKWSICIPKNFKRIVELEE